MSLAKHYINILVLPENIEIRQLSPNSNDTGNWESLINYYIYIFYIIYTSVK